MFGEILFNLASLISMCILSTFLLDLWPLERSRSLWIQGVIFGLIAVMGMAFPVKIDSGFIYDGRSIVLCLAAWHYGWRATLASAGIAVLYRLGVGGPGGIPGSLVILSSSGIGLAFRQCVNPEKRPVSVLHTMLLAYAVHIGMIFLLVFWMQGADRDFFVQEMVALLLTVYPLATILAGRILGDQQEKHRTRTQMALSENLIRNVFDQSGLIVLLVDPGSGRILNVNDAAVATYGYSKKDFARLSLPDLQPTGSKAPPLGKAKDIAGPTPFEHLQHRIASGEVREMDVCSSTIHFEGRNVIMMLVVDITERLHAMHALKESLQEKEDILQTAMDGFWITDDQFVIQDVNEAYCSLTGYIPEEIIGERCGKFDMLSMCDALVEEIKHCETLRFKTRHRTKDGQLLDLEASLRRKTTREGTQVYIFFRDITEEIASQERMKLLSTCLSVTANAVMITDADHRIEWVNTAFLQQSGYRMDEVMGRKPGELLKSGEHSESFYQNFHRIIHSGEVFQGEMVNRRKDESLYRVEATITPLTDEQGKITHFIFINQDITEKREWQNLYLRSQRLDTIGTLTSGIAHDLNNILSPILLSAEYLHSQLPEGPEKEMAERIVSSADRGGKVLHQLLDFARGTTTEKQLLSLEPLLRESFKLYRETFPKRIEMREQVEKDLPAISADPGQVSQVLGNLMVNARDAMPEEGVLTLEASAVHLSEQDAKRIPLARKGDFVRVRVQDTGTGMSSETLERVFDPFFTTKPRGKGTGLGLSTCLSILKGHQGFMALSSEEGAGTEVTAYFPVSKQKDTAPASESTGQHVPVPGKGKRILVVDDEESIRFIISAALTAQGYQVVQCADGREALDLLEKQTDFTCVLLDCEMPEMGGIELLKYLDEQNFPRPILFITGSIAHQGKEISLLSGRPVLFKPFSISDLMKALEKLLGEQSS